METTCTSETSIYFYETVGAISQNDVIFILAAYDYRPTNQATRTRSYIDLCKVK
jgi:hypothetical protein